MAGQARTVPPSLEFVDCNLRRTAIRESEDASRTRDDSKWRHFPKCEGRTVRRGSRMGRVCLWLQNRPREKCNKVDPRLTRRHCAVLCSTRPVLIFIAQLELDHYIRHTCVAVARDRGPDGVGVGAGPSRWATAARHLLTGRPPSPERQRSGPLGCGRFKMMVVSGGVADPGVTRCEFVTP
ncbi:hypothetical protein EVAR_70381_1 [Eumeta japonica]|uniref:Uncharacterized protein n=1 Tax=Eumeta variegata TaxID=151549 RepID=A0A4C2A848_EUMVA|nr:hypothetical protein EVAR_70381_1 [Eumeta japonica]